MACAQVLDPAVEPGLVEQGVQPVVEHVPRRRRHLVPADQQRVLHRSLPPQRHAPLPSADHSTDRITANRTFSTAR